MGATIVRMAGKLIDGQDGLTACYNAIARNKPADCDLPMGTLIGQLRDWAVKQLQDSHVCFVRFANGDQLTFIGALPPGVSEESAVKAAMRHLQ
jgi:hypothetical protein